MMEISYRRNLRQSFMVIQGLPFPAEDPFSLDMLLKGGIPKLLPARRESMDGEERLLYEISSRQAMDKRMEMGGLSLEQILSFLDDLKECFHQLEEYLLSPEQLLLRPDCVFLDATGTQFSFCLHPGYAADPGKSLQNIFEQLLAVIDYENPQLVRMVYELHQITEKEGYSLNELEEAASLFRTEEQIRIQEFQNSRGRNPEQMKPEEEAAVPGQSVINTVQEDLRKPPDGKKKSFWEMFRLYRQGKTLREIVSDIDEGIFLQKLHRAAEEPEEDRRMKMTGEVSILKGDERSAEVPVRMNLDVDEEKHFWETFEQKNRSSHGTVLLGKDSAVSRRLVGLGAQQGTVIVLRSYPFHIGKEKAQCKEVVDCSSVSRLHARIGRSEKADDDGEYWVEDLNSTNGTYINGIRLDPYTRTAIRPGDLLSLADQEFLFK